MSGRSVLGKRWRLLDEQPLGDLADPRELLVRLLRLRGVRSSDEARAFLSPTLPQTVALPNLADGLDRIETAIRNDELIAVYGDYDADGITGAAVLYEGLRELGARVISFIPDRFVDGYGLNTRALSALIDRGAGLVVTVDTGTSAVHEVAYANDRGLDVIVVDHHLPKAQLPDAVAVVNPHLVEGAGDSGALSGCGVAFMVLAALAERLGRTFEPDRYLDLVAISTVCDVVPLVGVNRAIVAAGLRRLAGRHRPGLAALLEAASLDPGRLTAEDIAFRIGPRLNAAGRLGNALTAFELLTSDDSALVEKRAKELNTLNRRRQQLTEQALALGTSTVEREQAGDPLVMVGDPSVHQGIAGLVAGKLAERFYRPAIVYNHGEVFSTGSARSIPEVDIHALLARGEALLERFGGHHQAAGFTVRTERLPELQRVLEEAAGGLLDWPSVSPALEIDLELPLDLPIAPVTVLGYVRQLEPCGERNRPPLFLARAVRVVSSRTVGADGGHLQMTLAGGRQRTHRAIAFNLGGAMPRAGTWLDVVYAVKLGRYGDPELEVKDFISLEG